MNRFKFYSAAKTVTILKDDDEQGVIPNAAYTPAQMAQLSEKGIPVSMDNTALVSEQGSLNPTWDIPLERQRGTDVADLWSAQVESRSRLNAAYKDEYKYRKAQKAYRKAQDEKILAQAKAQLQQLQQTKTE